MAFNDQEQQDVSAGADPGAGDGGDGADDLSSVLGSQDTSFVSGDTKKPLGTGTLIMAGFLLACGVGTYVMYTRSAPAKATPTAEAAAAQTTITQFLSDDKENVSKMRDLLQNTEKAVEQFRDSPGKKQVPVEDLKTNPFRLAADEEEGEVANTDDVTSRKREEAARAAMLKAAQGLNLQFIMSGGRRKSCMINQAVYREGQAVGEFTVESITASAVVVRKGDARFELRMTK